MKKKTLEDYDRWYQPCDNCGYDTGKGTNNRCWKCGHVIYRDFSERALKNKIPRGLRKDNMKMGKEKKVKGGKMTWGKFKGCYIRFVEEDYLQWVKENCDWDDTTRDACVDELARRKDGLFGV